MLREIIIEKIKNEGPISFHDFMEMALYFPELGYYTSPRPKIGKQGDFYTSPYFTSVFGEMMGKQLEEMWQCTGGKEFTIVEYGAGTGALCNDIHNYLQKNPELYAKLQYCIIEKSPQMQQLEQQKIKSNKIKWVEKIEDLAPFTGCVLFNELVDNLAVHLVQMEEELMEVFVDYDNGFKEMLKPAGPMLKDYFHQLQVQLPKGYRTEICLEAVDLLKEISGGLDNGFVMTIDYGFPSTELYSEKRKAGTIVCFHKHQVSYNPYINIGDQDITTHINFSALKHFGEQCGFTFCGYTNQAHFLRSLGLVAHLKTMEQSGAYKKASQQEIDFMLKTFVWEMGSRFKVLIQQKGMRRPMLSGLRFPQPV